MAKVSDIFDIRRGHQLDYVYSEPTDDPDGVNFILRKSTNNGVAGRVVLPDGLVPGEPGEITVALVGSILSSYVQLEQFVCAQNIEILTPKNPMGLAEKLWWCAAIKANAGRYCYGRTANRTFRSLELPDECPAEVKAMGDELPDLFGDVAAPATEVRVDLPPVSEWGEFRLDELFNLVKGERIVASRQEPGDTPYVGGSRENNSVTNRFDIPAKYETGLITVTYNGTIGYATVQPEAFHACDDVHVLYPRQPIPDLAKFFVCALIRKEAERYSFGRKWHLDRMRPTPIKLSVTATGTPDWELIESYMRGLPWSSTIAEESTGHE